MITLAAIAGIASGALVLTVARIALDHAGGEW